MPINQPVSILQSPIEYLKGVGPYRADLLKKELNIFTFNDLLEHYPYRHVDKTRISLIRDINLQTEFIQVAGKLVSKDMAGEKRGKRLVAKLRDGSGVLELVWFQGINWIDKSLEVGADYLVYGRVGFFNGMPQITHPEIENMAMNKAEGSDFLEPVYPTTEKLKAKGLGGRQLGKLMQTLFDQLRPERDLPENLPDGLRQEMQLMSRHEAILQVHFPGSQALYEKAL
ncbi:MAG: ATP-dependent DNA helicase RecG, partial [Bacteroidetes bacterium]|nr:ATP-dependent DNA helicase RecG [Bacteroidota bacterium]